MKKLFFTACVLAGLSAHAQNEIKKPNVSIRWAPLGLATGNIGIQGEYNFGKNSLTAKIGVPVNTRRQFSYDDKDADFTMKATSFLAGYRTYLSRRHMHGFYFEPYFKYVHHTSEGTGQAMLTPESVTMSFTNEYNALGVGAQLGVQFLIRKRIALDLYFLGPEINSASNHLRAVDKSNSLLPWTDSQAQEARQDILDFVNDFPFIRNKVDVAVDRNNKTVQADFKGALPGFRAGISIGIAF